MAEEESVMAANYHRGDRSIGRLIGMSALAGALGALARGVYYMIVGAAMGTGPFAIPNLAGASVTGERIRAFDADTTIMGLLLHLLTGALFGVAFGLIVAYAIPRAFRNRTTALVSGLIFGALAYVVSLVVGPAINPLTTQIHNLLGSAHAFIGHLILGAVTSLALYSYRRQPGMSVMFHRETGARDRVAAGHYDRNNLD
jgi:uncharacterized membrane protein